MKSYEVIPAGRLGDTEALFPSDTIYSGELVADTEQTVTVPAGAEFVLFNSDGDFYTNYDTTAAVPTGTISEAGGELNPIKRYIGETSVIHIIADSSFIHITLAFFSK